jgi:hypothetical protein
VKDPAGAGGTLETRLIKCKRKKDPMMTGKEKSIQSGGDHPKISDSHSRLGRKQVRQAGVIHGDSTPTALESVGSTVPGGIETGRKRTVRTPMNISVLGQIHSIENQHYNSVMRQSVIDQIDEDGVRISTFQDPQERSRQVSIMSNG